MPERAACNACGSHQREPHAGKTRFLGIGPPHEVCRCADCGLIFLSPRPTLDELEALYAAEPYYRADNATRGAARLSFYGKRMDRLERWLPKRGSMLGIGCLEGGYALEVARSRGWQVVGVEFVQTLANHARRQLELEVVSAGGWDLSCLAGRQFDAIYGHSLEHVPDPRTTLRQCRALLRLGGVLMLEVPNQFRSLKDSVRGLIVNVLGARSQGLFVRPSSAHFHLYYFHPDTLRRLLASEGFEVIELRTYLPRHPVYRFNRRLRWVQEAIYAVGGPFERGPMIEVIAR